LTLVISVLYSHCDSHMFKNVLQGPSFIFLFIHVCQCWG